jgi:archaellum component FlaC
MLGMIERMEKIEDELIAVEKACIEEAKNAEKYKNRLERIVQIAKLP